MVNGEWWECLLAKVFLDHGTIISVGGVFAEIIRTIHHTTKPTAQALVVVKEGCKLLVRQVAIEPRVIDPRLRFIRFA